jgi:regulatory protein
VAGRITDIKVQRRNRKRVSVYLDGEYGFSLGVLVAAPLGRGDTLSDEEIEELELRDLIQTAYDRTLKYLAYRPRSSAEISRYLRGKGVAKGVSEQVLLRLRASGLVDDTAFAQYWVENRERFRPRGRRLLRQELREKGISNHLIDEALSDVKEGESAYEASLQRVSRWANLDDETFGEKMYSFLRRRGFEYEAIAGTVSRLLQERAEGEASGA